MKINQVEKVAPWPFSGASQKCMECLLSCASLGQVQVKTSQHASEGNLSLLGKRETFCFAFKRKLKRHATKQKQSERDKVQARCGGG